MHVRPQHELGVPFRKPAAAAEAVALGHPPGYGQHQGQGQIGGGVGEHVRGVGHGHAPGGGRVQVDVVVAHRVVGHDPQLGAGRVQGLAVDALGQKGQDALHAPGGGQELLPGHGPVVGVHAELEVVA